MLYVNENMESIYAAVFTDCREIDIMFLPEGNKIYI